MGKEKKKHKKDKVVEAEFEISMHCYACERSVAKAISKIKGVDTFTTDMRAHRVKIKGPINPEKVVKKLKKKTGKKVEIRGKTTKDDEEKIKDDNGKSGKNEKEDPKEDEQVRIADSVEFESILLTMFSDENPNACSIM